MSPVDEERTDSKRESHAQIAHRMHITVSAVKKLCRSVCKHYGVKGKAGLVRLAIRLGVG